MSLQEVLVGICVLAALFFMGRKLYRTLKRSGGCGCGSGCKDKDKAASSGGCCSCSENKAMQEIRPK